MCEKYCNSAGKKSAGTDQLTTTLNSYLSKIVEGVSHHSVSACEQSCTVWLYLSPPAAIIAVEGDIVKFAGDALLAFWSCSKFEAVQTVIRVLSECLKLQNKYDKYQTVDGSTLRMKLGISVGKLDVYHIGECMCAWTCCYTVTRMAAHCASVWVCALPMISASWVQCIHTYSTNIC